MWDLWSTYTYNSQSKKRRGNQMLTETRRVTAGEKPAAAKHPPVNVSFS
jgi:hypothetical protein